MAKGRRHKSKKYEQYYGEPYKPKTLKEVRRCVKCGREQPATSKIHTCPYCGATLKTIYKPVERERKPSDFG